MIHYDQSLNDYLALPGVRVSTLAMGCTSMKHLYHAMHAGDSSTRDQIVGTIVHAHLFGGLNQIAVYTGAVRRGRAYDAFAAENDGMLIVLKSEWDASTEIADSITDYSRRDYTGNTIRMMRNIDSNHEAGVTGEIEGVEIKGRIDCLCNNMLIDLKTTNAIEPRAFSWAYSRFHYGFKLECYRQLLSCNGEHVREVRMVIAENRPPYDVVACDVPIQLLEQYTDDVRKKAREYLECCESGEWPGIAARGEYHLDVWRDMNVDGMLDWSE